MKNGINLEKKMNKYIIRRWIAFGIITIIFSIAAFRVGYTYGHNSGFDQGVKKSIEHLESQLQEDKTKGV